MPKPGSSELLQAGCIALLQGITGSPKTIAELTDNPCPSTCILDWHIYLSLWRGLPVGSTCSLYFPGRPYSTMRENGFVPHRSVCSDAVGLGAIFV